ncbi:MAG: hypothetical protein JWP02_3840 [Acidimicrobiales bacterium]|nr:hypothetical protein [Acidimicrobiales bacterium]
MGAKWDWSRLDAFKPYLAALSGGATFYDFSWCEVEPAEGARDWSTVDNIARAARDLGFELYLKIRTGSCWATTGGTDGGRPRRRAAAKEASSMPSDIGAYQAFLADAVKHFSPLGVHEYAIENEINAPGHWAATPADYVTLVKAAATAVHGADAAARVVDGGVGSTVYGHAIARRLLVQGRDADAVKAYQQYFERRFAVRAQQLPQVANAAELRDALATPQAVRNLASFDVTAQLAQQHVIDLFEIHFYEKWVNLPALLDLVHASLPAAFSMQTWELGQFWPNAPTDEHVHATELEQAVTLMLDGGVPRVIWLPLGYNPNGRNSSELRFGLVDPDGRVRESGRVFAELAAAHART